MRVDHVVLNAKTELPALEGALAHFGFTLSPRGVHSLGSLNHVAPFRSSYLELVGLPPEQPDVRPDISRGNLGIDGVVFRSADAEETRASLRGRGYHPTQVREFSRPVDLGGTTGSARFRTVRLDPTPFPAGRVYFCQHLTPELVWRDGAMEHPNGSRDVREVVVVSARPQEQARSFAALAERDVEVDEGDPCARFEDCLVRVLSPSGYRSAYGSSALDAAGRTEFFGALVLECESLSFFDELVPLAGWRIGHGPGRRVGLVSDERQVLIEFKQGGEGRDGQEPG